jgi:hypothetical protein
MFKICTLINNNHIFYKLGLFLKWPESGHLCRIPASCPLWEDPANLA